MNKVLVVYYSRTGSTRRIAREIACELDADCEAIVDHTERRGLAGYHRCASEAWRGRLVEIDPPVNPIAGYDLVIIGTPTWCLSLSSPVRTFLRRHRDDIANAAFFCTYRGWGAQRVFRQMALELGKDPTSVLAIRERDVATELAREAVRELTAELGREAPSRESRDARGLSLANAATR